MKWVRIIGETEFNIMTDTTVQQEINDLTTELNGIISVKITLNDNLQKASGWMFFLSVVLAFVAIFSQFWIGGVAVAMSIVACVMLIYKSRIRLVDHMDVNFWLLERSAKISSKLHMLLKDEDTSSTTHALAIAECCAQLQAIKTDRKAYQNDNFTDFLQQYYDDKYTRDRYSAKLKNKYNKHEIKEIG